MRTVLSAALITPALAALLPAASPGGDAASGATGRAQKPHFEARRHQTEYTGPGRELPAPTDVTEIRVGYFGPTDPTHDAGGDLWRAACLAVEEVNRGGGCRGKPVRLLPCWAENPWGTGVARVARMAYADGIWAIIGSCDGPSTHLVEQVAAKARITLVNPGSTDKTVNLANVPWMFSCLPGDHLIAPVLTETLAGQPDLCLVSATDHDSRLFVAEVKKCLARQRQALRFHFEVQPGRDEYGEAAARVTGSAAHTVVVVAAARDGARMVTALREQGYTGRILGGPRLGRRQFMACAGRHAEGVLFPLLFLSGDENIAFFQGFRTRYGVAPDYAAAAAYDAVRLVLGAIENAGLNRARIRDAVGASAPWPGVTGTITWDPLGSNRRPVAGMGTIRAGRVVPLLKATRVSENPSPPGTPAGSAKPVAPPRPAAGAPRPPAAHP